MLTNARGYVMRLSVPHKTRVALHQMLGMSKVAYHRMLVEGLEVVKCSKR